MATYTDTTSILNELQTTVSFSSSTIPSVSAVTSWIEEESAYVEQLAGISFTQTTTSVDIDYNGDETITLKHSPILAVHSFLYATADLGSSEYTTKVSKIEDTDFTVYKNSGEISLLDAFSPKEGRKRFTITYSHGYSSTPATVKKLTTKLVVNRILNTLLNQHINESNDGGSISVGSISIVEPASYGVNTYKTLKMDIENLKDEVVKGFGVYRYDG